ncbi:o-succinylbenzoate--CoA ligase [Shewanella baltica]|uniref:o-succinylbenzoate--CoA ligase n=1 Tax=Shewanella baltica TaxID=62322 RepID=UPI00217E04BA|nr:o-succinylbenzoate--CoA ligase [Shewanella baltica]MCS6236726.1 o-succinylbenzoate--CoA ligase [Shewanella baltica]MCS6271221.1 o-succinylbenzoate--CoA ligase [Shewanella baltica]
MSATHLSKSLALSPVHQAALAFPQQTAIKLAGQDIRYSELSQRVIALGQQIRAAGIAEGEPLACIAVNNLEMICLYWACIDIGAIFFPISPRFPLAQIQGLIDEHQIRYVWRAEISDLQNCSQLALDFNRLSNDLAQPIDITRPANVILTSGSSGFPKAAVHCLANHIANAEGARSLIPLEQGDAWLLSLPLFHIGGLAILNRCALVGATVVMPDQTLSLSQQIDQDKLTHLSLVPAQLSKLLADTSSKLKSIKALVLGGGAVSIDLLAELKLRNIASYTSYGMTEMGSQITTGLALSDGSSGKLLPKRELKIEDSVIWVRGECLFMGYLTPEGIQAGIDQEGWFYTRDRGEWDENGNLRILGRVDNMFICGGENIQPEEIEAALKQHPQIDDAIVFAIPDAQFGNLPAAIIRGSLTHHTESIASELELFLADKIARFKRPRQYYVWPENHEQTGLKVNRKALIANLVKH